MTSSSIFFFKGLKRERALNERQPLQEVCGAEQQLPSWPHFRPAHIGTVPSAISARNWAGSLATVQTVQPREALPRGGPLPESPYAHPAQVEAIARLNCFGFEPGLRSDGREKARMSEFFPLWPPSVSTFLHGFDANLAEILGPPPSAEAGSLLAEQIFWQRGGGRYAALRGTSVVRGGHSRSLCGRSRSRAAGTVREFGGIW